MISIPFDLLVIIFDASNIYKSNGVMEVVKDNKNTKIGPLNGSNTNVHITICNIILMRESVRNKTSKKNVKILNLYARIYLFHTITTRK